MIARWESRNGNWYVELRDLGGGTYDYEGDGIGGLFPAVSNHEAIAHIQAKVDAGLFQPDAAKWPMRRVR